MKRKIVVLLLSTSLLFGEFDFKDYLGGFSNTTAGQTWQSGLNEGLLITGGAYEYRYNFSGNMKPLFAAQMPSVKVGCGGIGVDAGFLAFLGLDDIELQFTDASAAFAFGFMSALEYTMPEIAAIIHKLQQWARMLQELLGKACQSGKALGKMFSENLFGAAENDASKDGVSSFIGFSMNPAEKTSKMSKWIDDFWPGGDRDASIASHSSKKDIVTKIKNYGGGSSLMLSIFGNYLPEFSNNNDPSIGGAVINANLEGFLRDKKIGDHPLVFDASAESFEEKKNIYLLVKILFGEVYASDSSIGFVNYYFDSQGKMKPEALKADLQKAVFGGGKYHISPGYLKGSPYSAEEIASALMFGFGEITGDANDEMRIPNNKLIYIDAKIQTGAGGKVAEDHNNTITVNDDVVPSDMNSTLHTIKALMVLDNSDGYFTVKFEGFMDGSLTAIKAKVEDINVTWTDITVPNAVPGMGKYLKTLRLMYKKNNSDLTVQTMEKNLAELNAYYVATSFLSHIESMIMYQKNNAKVALTKDGTKMLRDNLDKLTVRIKEIKKALEKKIPKLATLPAVSKDFEMLDNLIKENISRTVDR